MKEPLTPKRFVELAREWPNNEYAPYAFEKRVMARLREVRVADGLSLWTQALWRATGPCLAIMILTATISFLTMGNDLAVDGDGGDLETAVFAPTQMAFDLNR